MHQIVMNLSTNAYHAMEDAVGELKVSLNEMEKLMLERLGYQVTSRSSSIEALEAFRATH